LHQARKNTYHWCLFTNLNKAKIITEEWRFNALKYIIFWLNFNDSIQPILLSHKLVHISYVKEKIVALFQIFITFLIWSTLKRSVSSESIRVSAYCSFASSYAYVISNNYVCTSKVLAYWPKLTALLKTLEFGNIGKHKVQKNLPLNTIVSHS
jgi:hypothetical protein